MQRIEITHVTRYRYAQPVRFLMHKLHLRPREGHDIRIESSELHIEPAYRIRWQRDIYGNSVALVEFETESDRLEIESTVVVEQYEGPLSSLDIDDPPQALPVTYDDMEQICLVPYQTAVFPEDAPMLDDWLAAILGGDPGDDPGAGMLDVLDRISRTIVDDIDYINRNDPGVQTPGTTLRKVRGSCRDSATLFIEACRRLGLASRFVSGYLVSGAAVEDVATTHAWAEVYLPGAGWRGFDTTSGQLVAGDHIAVAVHRHPEAIPPVSGSYVGPAKPKPVMEVDVRAERV